jgi:hypothetical protein
LTSAKRALFVAGIRERDAMAAGGPQAKACLSFSREEPLRHFCSAWGDNFVSILMDGNGCELTAR